MNHTAYQSRKNLAIKEFQYILENYILPLINVDGKLVLKCEPTRSQNLKSHIKCYEKRGEHFIYFFPALATPQFHFRVKTQNPNQDFGVAEMIIREILLVSSFDYRSDTFDKVNSYDRNNIYRNAKFDVAFEVGLCAWLGSACIYELIQRLRIWSQKTYEGNHMAFGFIIDSTQNSKGSVDYVKFLKSNHSAVFTDGIISGIKLDCKGKIVKYFSAIQEHTPNSNHTSWTPYEFLDFTNMCRSESGSNWVGVIMQSNGDILIFKSQTLIFVKRNGKWMYLDSYTIHTIIGERYLCGNSDISDLDKKVFADELYLSILDTSFAHTGGCIAVVDSEYVSTVEKNCFPDDSLDDEAKITEKKEIIRQLIKTGTIDGQRQYFQYLDRKLRLELLSLDGATVLDSSGKILCAGAIVKINGGSEEGARLAATKELSKYGLAIKISMDGSIRCFVSKGKEKNPTEIFKTL